MHQIRELAFDGGFTADAVRRLIGVSTLREKVELSTRPHMVDPLAPRTLEVRDVTSYGWSSGEEALWDLLCSMAGAGTVNLAQLAGVVDAELRRWALAAVAELFRIEPEDWLSVIPR